MRPTHNTPIPNDIEFPIPDDCSCDDTVGTWEPCPACQDVLDTDAQIQKEDAEALITTTKENH